MVIKCAICGKEVDTKYSGTKYCKRCSQAIKKKYKHKKRVSIDKLRKEFQSNRKSIYTQTLCWNCGNAYGKCPWTEVDELTNRVKFQPVPGWVADKTNLKLHHDEKDEDFSYLVHECPMFIKESERSIEE